MLRNLGCNTDKGASSELVENGVEPGGYTSPFLPFVAFSEML
jgi:hypothetical protein